MNDSQEQRTARLTQAARARAAGKHRQVRRVVDRMLEDGYAITVSRVARQAGVSRWLLYNAEGLRECIAVAMDRQAHEGLPDVTRRAFPKDVSAASLQADLALAREEVRQLRGERDRLRRRLQDTLGAEVEGSSKTELIARIHELEQAATGSRSALEGLQTQNADARAENGELREQLEEQRAALRRLMRQQNRIGE